MVRRTGPAASQPLQADPWAPPLREVGRQRNRLRAPVLDVHLEVILHVLADADEIVHDGDAERFEIGGVADARELEQLWRVERAAATDDLAAHRALDASAALRARPAGRVLDAHR